MYVVILYVRMFVKNPSKPVERIIFLKVYLLAGRLIRYKSVLLCKLMVFSCCL